MVEWSYFSSDVSSSVADCQQLVCLFSGHSSSSFHLDVTKWGVSRSGWLMSYHPTWTFSQSRSLFLVIIKVMMSFHSLLEWLYIILLLRLLFFVVVVEHSTTLSFFDGGPALKFYPCSIKTGCFCTHSFFLAFHRLNLVHCIVFGFFFFFFNAGREDWRVRSNSLMTTCSTEEIRLDRFVYVGFIRWLLFSFKRFDQLRTLTPIIPCLSIVLLSKSACRLFDVAFLPC